jgi:hypothetical protein
MSRDGLLPGWAKAVHPKYRTPYITTILTGIAVSIAAGFTPIGILGELVSIGTLLAFVIVSLGILALRYKRPELDRPFKTPWVPFVPILSPRGHRPHGRTPLAHLAAIDHLDDPRRDHLLRLRPAAQHTT